MSSKCSENWAREQIQDDAQVIYDVLVDKDSWLVTGKKRGTFTIAVSSPCLPTRYYQADHVSITPKGLS